MVTFAQAQERAEEWINGDVPGYQHREVRVREFELGFVVWAEDREGGPISDGGGQRLVIARDSGDATLWPSLPVGEVIRRYEEEYGAPAVAPEAPAPQSERIDLNQTSFLLTPPEWLQEAADSMGIPDRRSGAGAAGGSAGGSGRSGAPDAPVPADPGPAPTDPGPSPVPAAGGSGGAPWPAAGQGDGQSGQGDGPGSGAPSSGVAWAGTDVDGGSDDRSVPPPATVFAPPLSGADDDSSPPAVEPEAKTALISGGSQLPPTAVAPSVDPTRRPPQAGAGAPDDPSAGPHSGAESGSGAADIADAATSKAQGPPPGAPGAPGAGAGGTPPPAGGYAPTSVVPEAGPAGPGAPGAPGAPQPPGPPGAGGSDGGGVHHAATMLADPSQGGGIPQPPAPPGPPGAPGAANAPGGPGAPPPPGPPGTPGAPPPPGPPGTPGTPPPGPPGAPGAPGGTPPPAPGGVHHAATMLAGPSGPGAPQPPGPPPGAPQPAPGRPQGGAYGYPQPPAGAPLVGPGYQAVLRYRAQDGSEQQLIRRSAPGTPHPEWQILHELRAMNVPPQQVLELHTELESCELPGAYCARMIRETWPQARITSIAPYGKDQASRQQGMQQLIAHQGELHQVADGPARSAPVRAPLQPMPPAPPVPPEGVAHELASAFGPGVFRFDQRAVSRQGVPDLVAHTLMMAGLPVDFGPFFWAQAQPGRPVPTLAELAQERAVQPASDAGSYLVMGSDFGRAICVQYGTAHIVAVPVEAGPGGAPVPPQFVNTGLPEFVRCLALLGHMWRLRFGLNQEQAGRWTVDFQQQLSALDPAALSSPESWWSVLLEQMWDGLL